MMHDQTDIKFPQFFVRTSDQQVHSNNRRL